MLDTGKVVKTEGEIAHILVKTGDQCISCGAKKLCSPMSIEERIIIAGNSVGASVNETVHVEETGSITLIIGLLQYGLPLIGFIAGILICYWVFPEFNFLPIEIVQFIAGLIGVVIGGVFARYKIEQISKNVEKYLTISKVN